MKIDATTAVREGEELEMEAISEFLNIKIEEITQFPGGFSNLTYLLKTDDGRELVLRRPPFGASAKGGHDMGREFRVLRLLKNAGYHKVPTPLSYEASGSFIGVPFYVMERLNGVILRAKDATNPALTPSVMARLSEKLIDNLADLHNLDIEKSGLKDLGKPEGYVKRQVDGWISRYKNAQTDDVSDMETVAEWMKNFTPIEQPPAFIHNDYKFDNVVWDANLTDIIGVLDWEMATVGDPLMDLGASLAYWCEADDPEFGKMFNISWLPGSPTRQEVAERYIEKTGRDLQDIHFYYIFGLYKNAVIIQQIYARWKKGLTQDKRFSGLISGVFTLSKMALKTIESGKI